MGDLSLPLLGLHKLRIGRRVGLALALPIIGVLALLLWIVSGYFHAANDMRDLRRIAELAPGLGDLVHTIQKERGVFAGFIGSGGTELMERLPARHRKTDEKRAAVDAALVYFDASRFGGTLASRIAAAREAVDQVEAWFAGVIPSAT